MSGNEVTDPKAATQCNEAPPGWEWWKSEATGFVVTREELDVLAAHYLERGASMEFFITMQNCVGLSDFRDMDAAFARLDEIEAYLGSKPLEAGLKFSATKRSFERKFREFRGEEQSCPLGGPNPHGHEDCRFESIDKHGALGTWPELSRDQAAKIFARKIFLGMTKHQASAALGFLVHGHNEETVNGQDREYWHVNWHPNHEPGPDDWIWCVFAENRLVAIEGTSSQGDDVRPAPEATGGGGGA